ncbi:tRNA (adenosine(37)-N6)-threonylcarbamoyltransferase complex dimerization subunit type 1 TsaB [Coralliovum pocilloporae]|uniref:tRNA (adenosine(37)-N6)-threonylcarbamoyltransferase complex dimerization subunit type 1 TsaB n=1 Tax=Coralliovum pocilloporae TaxID=3066369 RepID=UPI003306CB6C
MRILAIDTALAACSVAFADTESETLCSHSDVIGKGHAEHLPGLVDKVLAEAGATFGTIDRIAVTVGPGSFTGLRVGIAAARGYGLAVGCPVVGISTLDALLEEGRSLASDRPILAALDARRGQVYVRSSLPSDPYAEPAAVLLQDLAAGLDGYALIGSAAQLLLDLDAIRQDNVLSHSEYPDIQAVLRLGLEADTAQSPTPLYLRPPDAKPQTRARIARA